MSAESLNVIALISGGKDSFFSLLHCIQHGHRVVALANLFPVNDSSTTTAVQIIKPSDNVVSSAAASSQENDDAGAAEKDLNSFMYQTVGHEVIPLYAAATGLPLYRQPIIGGAHRHERDYAPSANDEASTSSEDETESMIPLLRTVIANHPEANALCAGAILSTYQRTRVESVALRLGLVPLAYLWKYPILPSPPSPIDDAQLLKDMAAAGLEARIIKVASAGLSEDHLWERVTSVHGAGRVKRALKKFGTANGATLGEGGEFETLVLDGPAPLFKKRISVPENGRLPVNEGGGSTWLMLRGAQSEDKTTDEDADIAIRNPDILDTAFSRIQDLILRDKPAASGTADISTNPIKGSKLLAKESREFTRDQNADRPWCFLGQSESSTSSIESETAELVNKAKQRLSELSLNATHIMSTIIVLRRMADFPQINAEYGKLFPWPNPPSRVTISCGDLLPPGCNIALYLNVSSAASSKAGRDGLHVQSRSYWAPANIGPYSQAISYPFTFDGQPIGIQSTCVAGQIPLVPASMLLPPASDTGIQQQIILSLQHLWRIGAEMRVQIWTSAVAYFARSSGDDEMKRNAHIASLAWKRIHEPREDDEEEESGPDLWDQRYNSEFMSLASKAEEKTNPLPDWSIYTLQQQNDWKSCVPPIFVAEVEELPRQSTVEWHAHRGLSQLNESCVEIMHCQVSPRWKASHVISEGTDAFYIHSKVYAEISHANVEAAEFRREAFFAYRESLRGLHPTVQDVVDAPYLVYFVKTRSTSAWSVEDKKDSPPSAAVIPCHSLWSFEGEKLACVILYEITIAPTSTGE